MKKPKEEKVVEEVKEDELDNSQKYLEGFFKANKGNHFNDNDQYQGTVSSGSMLLDSEIGGGFHAGVVRFGGASEGGKSSEALECMKRFLDTEPNGKGLYVKAEGRLSKKIKERSGINFIEHERDLKDWKAGSCFVIKCNIFEIIIDMIRDLMKNNKDGEHYFIIIDSMDGLLPQEAQAKTSSEAQKVAGGATLTGDLLKRMSLFFSEKGHFLFMMSQVRAKPKIDKYAKGDPNEKGSGSGGNAAVHYPDWMFEFSKPRVSNFILENPNANFDQDKNKAIGHYAEITILKGENENTFHKIKYPIKHGRKQGSSIWVEMEIIDLLVAWGYVMKAGSWIKLSEEVYKLFGFKEEDLKEDTKTKEKTVSFCQGMKKAYDYLEDNPQFVEGLKKFCFDNIINR